MHRLGGRYVTADVLPADTTVVSSAGAADKLSAEAAEPHRLASTAPTHHIAQK